MTAVVLAFRLGALAGENLPPVKEAVDDAGGGERPLTLCCPSQDVSVNWSDWTGAIEKGVLMKKGGGKGKNGRENILLAKS